MWDWDQDQPATPPERRLRTEQVVLTVLCVVFVALVALLLGIIMRVGHGLAEVQFTAAASAAPTLGGDLWVGNPDRFDLAAGEAMVLRGTGTEIRLTPGQVSRRSDPCHPSPITIVPLTVAVVSGQADIDARFFRLRTTGGERVEALEACTGGPLSIRAGDALTLDLAFASEAPSRLEYGMGPEASWRLV